MVSSVGYNYELSHDVRRTYNTRFVCNNNRCVPLRDSFVRKLVVRELTSNRICGLPFQHDPGLPGRSADDCVGLCLRIAIDYISC